MVPPRRPAPTMLFTAIAATVVILPWAADSGTGHRDQRSQPTRSADTHLAQQPLVGLGGGVTVREISQATPFSMVALTGGDLGGTSARIRARHADGSWGPWYETEALAGPGGHGSTPGPSGTDPVFVGKTTTVQIAVTRPPGAPPTERPRGPTATTTRLGYLPAALGKPLA